MNERNGNLVAALAQELNVTGYVPRTGKQLPQSVEDVADVFSSQFYGTARFLRERGGALIARGNELLRMSEEISEAGTNVPMSLKHWVDKEIEYREAAQSYTLINPEG